MRLRVIWTGKTRNRDLRRVIDDYFSRVVRYVGFDIVELKEPRTSDDLRRIGEESERILGKLGSTDFVVLLDAGGRRTTSEEFSDLIEGHMTAGQRDIVFVVGGPAGISGTLRDRSDMRLSLSTLTLSHDLARTLLLEQIYRALTIIRNLPYAR